MRRATAFPVAIALVAALAFSGSAQADEIPHRANIEDPAGDANGFNDQGFAFATGFQGNEEGGYSHEPADILRVWFSNTPGSVSVNILTTAPPTESDVGLLFSVVANEGCLAFEGTIPGGTYDGESAAAVYTPESEECGGTDPVPGALTVGETSTGQGITKLTFGMYSHAALKPGAWFFDPSASSSALSGSQEDGAVVGPQADNTQEGLSYRVHYPEPAGSIDSPPAHANAAKGKKKGHDKHGCKHKGEGHGHDGHCPDGD